jgi:hypothetical protein
VFGTGSTEDAGENGGSAGEHTTGSGGKPGSGGTGSTTDAGTNPADAAADATTAMDGGNTDGSASDGGANSDASASGGVTGAGGTTASGGTTGAGGAGTGGTVGDGGSVGSGGTGGCASLKTYYPDGDHDTYGRSTGSVTACAPPGGTGWSLASGDCDDDDDRVHPGQTAYFDTPYTRQSADTYDYDCSNDEDGDPGMEGVAPACGILSVVGCTGTGFQATARTGNGQNSLCGSKTKVTCQVNGLACNSVITTVQDGYRCH